MEILGFSKLRQEKNATDARKVFLYMKEDVTRVVSDVKELDTYQVRVFNEDKSDEDREEYTFEIPFQKGSIKVNGRNGVMIEELLEIVAMRITDLNGKFQCKENEEAIENLKKMEAEGVEILSCGTCLDFYNIKDNLAVGRVANMYDIVEALKQNPNRLVV